MSVRLVVLFALLPLVAAGCGRKRTIVVPGGSVSVTEGPGGNTATIQTPEGEATVTTDGDGQSGTSTYTSGDTTVTSQTGSAVEVTEEELGIAFYPGAKPAASTSGGDSNEQMRMVIFDTTATAKEVHDFYVKELGDRVESEMLNTMPEGAMAVVATKKDDGVVYAVTAVEGKDGNKITITRTEEKKTE